MCARYSLTSPPEAVRAFFDAPAVDDFPARYNIAPSQPVLIARKDLNGCRELQLVRWGLIPSWVRDPGSLRAPLINARAETAAEKPAFRGAMRHRRCLVPTTGFYEWTGRRGEKQPHLVCLQDQQLFALAGLWESWLGADGSEIETVAILTTAANAEMAHIHERMPVIIDRENFDRWLDCRAGTTEGLFDLLGPCNDGRLVITAISRRINDSRADGADLQHPISSDLLL